MDPAVSTVENGWLSTNAPQSRGSHSRSHLSIPRRTSNPPSIRTNQSLPKPVFNRIPFVDGFEEVTELGNEFSRLAVDGLSTHRKETKKIKGRSSSLDWTLPKREKSPVQKKSPSLPMIAEKTPRDTKYRRHTQDVFLETIDEQTPRTSRRHNRDHTLLKSIEMRDLEIWQGLCIANESIIETSKLFSLIHSRLQELEDGQQATALIDFCKTWLQENKKTELVRKVDYIFKEIKIFADDNSEDFGLMFIQKQEEEQDFYEIQQRLFKNRLKNTYEKVIGDLATDLLRWQSQRYSRLTVHHLIEKKWKNEQNLLCAYIKETQALYEYVVDAIICQPDIGNRARLVKFFLRIAQESLKMNNYPVASNIYYALMNGAVGKLKKTFEKCSDKKYALILEELSAVFVVTRNYAHLRSRFKAYQEESKPYIPFLAIYLKDLVNFGEMKAELPTDQSRKYNIEKLQTIKNSTLEYIIPQKNIPKYDLDPNFKTNFIKILARHAPLDDDIRHEKVEGLDT